MKVLLPLIILLAAIVAFLGYRFYGQQQSESLVSLGEEFALEEGQSITIKDTGLQVRILEFSNDDCEPDMVCIWSGQGINFEYTYNGETQTGVNLVQAFGHKTSVVDTDYATFALLMIRLVPDSAADNCGLNGLTFNSVEPQLLGEGPDGSVNLGYWTISFDNGTYQRFYSDVGENGTYSCAD